MIHFFQEAQKLKFILILVIFIGVFIPTKTFGQDIMASKDLYVTEYPMLRTLNSPGELPLIDTVGGSVFENEESTEGLNIIDYTPSKLLRKGQLEAQLFNNLYTQTAYRDENRELVELDTRDTYYSALFYAMFGVNKSGRINIGFDLNLKSVLIDSTKGSPLKVFKFQNSSNSRTALTSFGPKIKFQPFRNFSNFSIQSAFWIPIAEDLESIEEMSDYPWMDYHMYTWWNQFFFDKQLGPHWQLFTEADLLFRFKAKNGDIPTHVDIPLSIFISWFPGRKSTFYAQMQYSPRFQLQKSYAEGDMENQDPIIKSFDFVSDFAHAGLGFKYQISRSLNIELSSTYFFTSKNGGAGSTYNIGIRYIM